MIKTDTLEFNAGVEILDQMPGKREEVISYEGQYYIPPAGGFPIWRTKQRMSGISS